QLRVSGTIHADQRLPSDVAVQFETVILVVVNSVSAGAPTVDEHFAHRSMVSPFSRSTGRNATSHPRRPPTIIDEAASARRRCRCTAGTPSSPAHPSPFRRTPCALATSTAGRSWEQRTSPSRRATGHWFRSKPGDGDSG